MGHKYSVVGDLRRCVDLPIEGGYMLLSSDVDIADTMMGWDHEGDMPTGLPASLIVHMVEDENGDLVQIDEIWANYRTVAPALSDTFERVG